MKTLRIQFLIAVATFTSFAQARSRSDIYVDSNGRVHQGADLDATKSAFADSDRDPAKTADLIKSVDDSADAYMITKLDGRRNQGKTTEITKIYSTVIGKDGKPMAYEVASDSGHIIVQAQDLAKGGSKVTSGQALVATLHGEDEGRLIDVTWGTMNDLLKSKSLHDKQVLGEVVKVAEKRNNYARTRIAKFSTANPKMFVNTSTPTDEKMNIYERAKSPAKQAVEGAESDALRD